jgi:hypothetical protein
MAQKKIARVNNSVCNSDFRQHFTYYVMSRMFQHTIQAMMAYSTLLHRTHFVLIDTTSYSLCAYRHGAIDDES